MTTLIILTFKLDYLLQKDSLANLASANGNKYIAVGCIVILFIIAAIVIRNDKKSQKKLN